MRKENKWNYFDMDAIDLVIEQIESYYNLPKGSIIGRSALQCISVPRMMVYMLCRELGIPNEQLIVALKRDRNTLRYYRENFDAILNYYESWRNDYKQLQKLIVGKAGDAIIARKKSQVLSLLTELGVSPEDKENIEQILDKV